MSVDQHDIVWLASLSGLVRLVLVLAIECRMLASF